MSKWRLKRNGNGRLHLLSENGSQICAFWNCKRRDERARLIQHAPDLVDLLTEISNEARSYEARSGKVISWRERTDELLVKIREGDDE